MSTIGRIGQQKAMDYLAKKLQKVTPAKIGNFIDAEWENIKGKRVSNLAVAFLAWNRVSGGKIVIGSMDDWRDGGARGSKVFIAGGKRIYNLTLPGQGCGDILPAGVTISSMKDEGYVIDPDSVKLGEGLLPDELSDAVSMAETEDIGEELMKLDMDSKTAYDVLVFQGKVLRVSPGFTFTKGVKVDGYDETGGWTCQLKVEIPNFLHNLQITIRSGEYGNPFVEPIGEEELKEVLAVVANPEPDYKNFGEEETRCKILDKYIRGDYKNPRSYWFVAQRDARKESEKVMVGDKEVTVYNTYINEYVQKGVTQTDYGLKLIGMVPVEDTAISMDRDELADMEDGIAETTTEEMFHFTYTHKASIEFLRQWDKKDFAEWDLAQVNDYLAKEGLKEITAREFKELMRELK